MRKIFIPFLFSAFLLTGCIILHSCEMPLSFEKFETVTVSLPEWPEDGDYPSLLFWKVITTRNKKSFFMEIPGYTKTVIITVPKDDLASIKVQPVIDFSAAPDFFCPAGLLYPIDFNNHCGKARWENYVLCLAAEKILMMEDCFEKQNALRYFNWQKLEETLNKKDEEAFSKFDSLKTKKCTTSFNTDIDTLISRIIEPPSRFTVPYFDTSSVLPSKIKNLSMTSQSILLHDYIPLNQLYKEKGCITVQTKPENHNTAFILDNKVIYVRNKTLTETASPL